MPKLVVTSIGPASSVQDAGRPGAQRYGLPPETVMDAARLHFYRGGRKPAPTSASHDEPETARITCVHCRDTVLTVPKAAKGGAARKTEDQREALDDAEDGHDQKQHRGG